MFSKGPHHPLPTSMVMDWMRISGVEMERHSPARTTATILITTTFIPPQMTTTTGNHFYKHLRGYFGGIVSTQKWLRDLLTVSSLLGY